MVENFPESHYPYSMLAEVFTQHAAPDFLAKRVSSIQRGDPGQEHGFHIQLRPGE
jgi:hypothetical protein